MSSQLSVPMMRLLSTASFRVIIGGKKMLIIPGGRTCTLDALRRRGLIGSLDELTEAGLAVLIAHPEMNEEFWAREWAWRSSAI